MSICVYSKSNFIQTELKKDSHNLLDIMVTDDFNTLNTFVHTQKSCVLMHHVDDFNKDINDAMILLLKNNPHVSAIALSNQPNELQGCQYLQNGYKSYLHTLSNQTILHSAIESVSTGNIYVYPKLMQFLVSQIPNNLQPKKSLEHLTPKELEVLQLVSQGFSNAKIATELDIAEVTVKKHIGVLFDKLQVKDRLSLALILR